MKGWNVGKCELLEYLITVAQKTEGAEVWRALFAEMLRAIKLTDK